MRITQNVYEALEKDLDNLKDYVTEVTAENNQLRILNEKLEIENKRLNNELINIKRYSKWISIKKSTPETEQLILCASGSKVFWVEKYGNINRLPADTRWLPIPDIEKNDE